MSDSNSTPDPAPDSTPTVNKNNKSEGVKVTVQWTLYLIFFFYFTSKIIEHIPPIDSAGLGQGVESVPWAIWIYAILCYAIIVVIKSFQKKTNGQIGNNSNVWWKDYLNDFIYMVLTLFSYIFGISYLSMKLRNRGSMYGGGMVGELKNVSFLKKGSNVPVISSSLRYVIFMGAILITFNCLSSIYMYLKNRDKYENDDTIHNIYKSQLSVLLIVFLTMLSLIVLGGNIDWSKTDSSSTEEIIKWVFMFIILIVCSVFINKDNGTKFFGVSLI
jgi:hypothetical protein